MARGVLDVVLLDLGFRFVAVIVVDLGVVGGRDRLERLDQFVRFGQQHVANGSQQLVGIFAQLVDNKRQQDTARAIVQHVGHLLVEIGFQVSFGVVEELVASDLRVLLARLGLVASLQLLHVLLDKEAAVSWRYQIGEHLATVLVVEQLLDLTKQFLFANRTVL